MRYLFKRPQAARSAPTSQPWPEAENSVCTSTSSAEPSTSDTQSLDSGPTPAKKTKVASKWQEDWKHYNMK